MAVISRVQEFKSKAMEAIDQRVRIITAGMGLDELRAVLRGDPPTERPNPRYKVHTTSFLFHIRPRYYERGSTIFTHTYRLGFFTAFFFFVELFTGLILMVYYTPSPEKAYTSILELMNRVPFGLLLRDIHRFGAEGMVIFTALHMLRTFLTGSYKKERSFTWLTGLALLGVTLGLSFSGYLLPWDQLAYWAVTVGTSMADAIPLFGEEANLLLRGAPDIGANGLLRFYLGHVVLLPLAAILLISVHYYKVAREHSISQPAKFEEGNVPADVKKEVKQRIDLIPDLLTHEIFLVSLGLLILVLAPTVFGYHAPLENVANPLQTPQDTEAPWYFWWLQGMLKVDPANILENLLAKVGITVELSRILNSKQIMGIVIPGILTALLVGIPYIDRNPHRSLHKRPWAVGAGLLAVLIMGVLSYMGTPAYGIGTPPAIRILQDLSPEEGDGPLDEIPFDQLVPGVYVMDETDVRKMCPTLDFGCPELEAVFTEYIERVTKAEENGGLPDAQAVLIIEDWQEDLRKVTPRIIWVDPESGSTQTYEKNIFLHRNRIRE
jgi:ubiquinol-cytochrome c reductase cytochrome b subunit